MRGSGEAGLDELVAEIGEPVWVGGGDGDFDDVVVGHAGASAPRSTEMAGWSKPSPISSVAFLQELRAVMRADVGGRGLECVEQPHAIGLAHARQLVGCEPFDRVDLVRRRG